MKFPVFAITFSLIISFFYSCRKNTDNPFDYERAAGLWVPYETIDQAGQISAFTSTTNSVFGSYAASVQLNADQTYIPVIWIDPNTIIFQTPEAGTFAYSLPGKLTFKGGSFTNGMFDFECSVVNFGGDDLWVEMHGTTWKFKRQH